MAVPIRDGTSLEVSVEQTREWGVTKAAQYHMLKRDTPGADVSWQMGNCGAYETRCNVD